MARTMIDPQIAAQTDTRTGIRIDIIIDDDIAFEIPSGIEAAVLSACRASNAIKQQAEQGPELCIRFASDQSMQRLNQQWRDKDAVTDVLSFPMQQAPYDFSQPLGDIALAVPFIEHEANRLGLPVAAHCLHLIIHATLHLLGHDHGQDTEAEQMQALEQAVMRHIGLHNPYADGPISVSCP